MADQITQDENGNTYRNGVLQTHSNASPGVSGAISDMVKALAQAFAPKSITQRGAKVAQAIDQADPTPANSGAMGDQF
jgi:hypothetical protein